MKEKAGILLVGGGGHCRSVIDVLEAASMPIAGIIHGNDCAFEPLFSYPALGRDDKLPDLRAQHSRALVTVGQIKSATLRIQLFNRLKELGFALPSVISPSAALSARAELGEGSILMHHALVNAGAAIGHNCILNTKSLIEHDCIVEEHCHIAVGATLCGGVRVGAGSFIGAGACVRENVRIGANCLIGMGCMVRRDLPPGMRYVG